MSSPALHEYLTWVKYVVMSVHIDNIKMKEKRSIFQLIRTDQEIDHNTFLPRHGLTLGEFATFQVLKGQMPSHERDGSDCAGGAS